MRRFRAVVQAVGHTRLVKPVMQLHRHLGPLVLVRTKNSHLEGHENEVYAAQLLAGGLALNSIIGSLARPDGISYGRCSYVPRSHIRWGSDRIGILLSLYASGQWVLSIEQAC